jgi:MFS-type transporter involved in bile tolerance (Atg22 family)
MTVTAASDSRIADMPQNYPPRAAVISWIFFDWAAKPFFTLITTFVFAPYFATHVASDPASGPILLVDKDQILFVKIAPPAPDGALFAAAAERAYLLLGCLIGAAGGPLQAASRTLLIRMAPKDRVTQYFGLLALTGKVTSFVGPLLIGAITAITASQKAGLAVLVVFFGAGLALLSRCAK